MDNKLISMWDKRFLNLALHKAQWSKDRTKVGCVITQGKQDKYFGYNGFPQNVMDTQDRLDNKEIKHQLVIHAEMNAILSAKESLEGHTLYCTHPPCIRCASHIIRVGIERVVCLDNKTTDIEKQQRELKLTREIFNEASIEFDIFKE